jgi:nitroreductase
MQAAARIEALDGLMQRRHSCRSFRSEPVTREIVLRMLRTAQRTASWCNSQSWQVHIVTGARLRTLLSALSVRAQSGALPAPELEWPKYKGVYQARRRECGWALYQAVGVAPGDRQASATQSQQNFRCFGAPHLAIVTSEAALGTHGVMDCGAWVANFMLAATALGVATIAQASIASWPDVLRQHLDIGVERRIVCGVSFGFENVDHPANGFRTTRAPMEDVVRWVE